MIDRSPPRRSAQQRPRNIMNMTGPRGDMLPSGPSGTRGCRPVNRFEGKVFGQVVSVNPGFGFIQPYEEKDQAYYNAPRDLEVGNEVAFTMQQMSRGLTASAVQLVPQDSLVSTHGQRGIITQAAEGSRCPVGRIEINVREASAGHESNSSPKVPLVVYVADNDRRVRPRDALATGDEVEFTLCTIPGTTYNRAIDIKLIRTRKERRRNEKIEALIAAGAVLEQGIVETINKGGEYGFVKCADRTGQLYFKLSSEDVQEGSEIQFIVMDEIAGASGGKGQNRRQAVHISVLPKGTVKFEVTLHAGATGVVIRDPVFYPKEVPGLIRIMPSPGNDGKEVNGRDPSLVELWPRCMPEGLLLHVGDSVQCDVVHYRPEKLIFARGVKVLSFRKLGREMGTVVKLQRRGGDSGNSGQFGFLKPDTRDHDVFFRIPDVVGADGVMLPDAEVIVGLRLSFDVIAENGARAGASGGAGRTRAIRASVEPSQGRSLLLPDVLSSLPGSAVTTPVKGPTLVAAAGNASSDGDTSKCLMRANVMGVIEKLSKKDVCGIIRILTDISCLAEVDFTDVLHRDIVSALCEFMALEEWKDISIEHVGPRARKTLHTIIQQKFPGVAHETLPNPGEHSSRETSKTVKLWKMAPADFELWEAGRIRKEKSGLTNRLVKMMACSGSAQVAPTELTDGVLPAHDSLVNPFYAAFNSSDLLPSRWAVDKGCTVNFNLCLDTVRNRLIATGVELTDEAPDECTLVGSDKDGWMFGRVDSVKHMKGGYIRCFSSDEKLRWEVPSVLAVKNTQEGTPKKEAKFNVTAVWNSVASLLVPETLVAFQIRVKGGVRCAVGLHAVPIKVKAVASSGDTQYDSVITAGNEIEGIAKPFPDAFYANVTEKIETLYGECIGVVVENMHLVLLDVSTCPLLVNKYYDMTDIAFIHWLSKQLSNAEAVTSGVNADSWARVETNIDAVSLGSAMNDVVHEEAPSDGEEKNGDSATNGLASGTVRYLPRLPNFPIPFYVETKLTSNGGHYSVGELVVCSLVANWALQRAPLHANILRKYDPSSEHMLSLSGILKTSLSEVVPLRCVLEARLNAEGTTEIPKLRRCGTVRRVLNSNSIFSNGKRDVKQRTSSGLASTVELWAEIVCELGTGSETSGEVTKEQESGINSACVFLYDMRGLPKPIPPENVPDHKENGPKLAATKLELASLSEGDLVDFIPVVVGFRMASVVARAKAPVCGMAVAVNLVRVSMLDKGKKLTAGRPTAVINPLIAKPRVTINSELKTNQAKSGGITMAEGPPNDASVGFPSEWRTLPDVSKLPWAHLLPHLACEPCSEA